MNKNIREELHSYDIYVNQVSDLFLWHFDSFEEAGKFFGVTARTVQNWQKKRNWPTAVVRLLLVMHRGYLPPSKAWRGFRIRGDKLYTPAGRELSAYDLQELDIRVTLGQNVIQFRRKKKNTNRRPYLLWKFRNRALMRPR